MFIGIDTGGVGAASVLFWGGEGDPQCGGSRGEEREGKGKGKGKGGGGGRGQGKASTVTVKAVGMRKAAV